MPLFPSYSFIPRRSYGPNRWADGIALLIMALLTLSVDSAWAQDEELPMGGTPTIDDSRCETPDVLVLLDRSGSMLNDMKWEQATSAVSEAFSPYFNVLRFGLLTFPTEGSCGVIETPLAIPIGEAEGADLDAIYESVLPVDIALTPLAESINAGKRALDAVKVPDRRGFIILLTDGIETCAPEALEDTAPVEAARAAADAGYTVYVIGFGSLVRRSVLNEMALVGGSERSRLVSDQASLEIALEEMVTSATTERCDLLDNDCDGRIDEGAGCEAPCYPEVEECPCTNNRECNLGEACEEGSCAPIPCQQICDEGYICRDEACIAVSRPPAGGDTAGSSAAGTGSPNFAGQMAPPAGTGASSGGTTIAGTAAAAAGAMATPQEANDASGCQAQSAHSSLSLLLLGSIAALLLTRRRRESRS